MLLQALSEYANRLDLPPEMYTKTRVQWFIDLDERGRLVQFTPLEGDDPKRPGRVFLAPFVGSTSNINPKLLVGSAEYVLGIPRDAAKAERVVQCHREFCALARRCAQQTFERSVEAVVHFLDQWDSKVTGLPEGFAPGDILMFRVGKTVPTELKSVQVFWAEESRGDAGKDDGPKTQCILCGKYGKVEERLPIPLKRIPGTLPKGAPLFSANEKAFESYGLHASLTAPTCRLCGERFANAANDLLAGNTTSIWIGSLAYIFWTREESDFDFRILSEPDPERVRTLIESAWKGRETAELDDNAFYATAFAANRGRVVVRDWIETTVPAAKKNLARWFQLQGLVDAYGEPGDPVSLYTLAASLYRNANTEMVARVPATLLRVALHGTAFPEWLLYQAVKRNRADQLHPRRPKAPGKTDEGKVYARMVLIKMILQSYAGEETNMEELDLTNRDPAYLCGRLFAELEQVQREAVSSKATLVDRYFGTASSAPATVFGTLLRGAQAHLAKLRKTREGAYHGIEKRLEEITAHLSEFPKTLALKQQALFSLGYYHQRAADRAAATAHSENKKHQEQEINDEGGL